MLSLGDGIALAGLFGIIITALVIWGGKKESTSVVEEPLLRRSTNGYVRESTCDAIKADIMGQLTDLKAGNSKLFSKMDGLDKYIREQGLTEKKIGMLKI